MIRPAFSLFLLSLALGFSAPASAQEGMKIEELVQAPGFLFLGEEVKVGYRLERETRVAGTATREFIAVVGEREDAWEVESTQGLAGYANLPDGKGAVYALVVDKKSHKVRSAKIGKPGEGALKEVRILKMKAPKSPGETKPDRAEPFELKSGESIPAEVYVHEVQGTKYTSFVGKKGTPYEGVLLRYEGASPFELSADPRKREFELKDTNAEGEAKTIAVIETTYTNGYTYQFSQDPIAKAFYGQMVGMASKSFTMAVTSLRSDAKKTLNWK